MLLFEHCPNLRIHLAGEKSLTSPHTDRDHQHSQAETLAAAVCEATSDPWRNHYAIRIYIYIYTILYAFFAMRSEMARQVLGRLGRIN